MNLREILGVHASLLEAVLHCPEDDSARIGLARCLRDEFQEHDYAELIEMQVMRIPCTECDNSGSIDREYFRTRDGRPARRRKKCRPCAKRRQREENLIRRVAPAAALGLASFDGKVDWRRGFVNTVRCRPKFWFENGSSILQHQPVENVQLTNSAKLEFIRLDPAAWCMAYSAAAKQTVLEPNRDELLRRMPQHFAECIVRDRSLGLTFPETAVSTGGSY